MDKYKLETYEKEQGKKLSFITALNETELLDFKEKIESKYPTNIERLYEYCNKNLNYLDFKDSSNSYKIIFNQFSLIQNTILYWDEENIDKISSIDLIKYWDYIWYKDSDEALILYFQEIDKLLMITHFGRMFY